MTDQPHDIEARVEVIQADREAAASGVLRRLKSLHGGEQPWMDASTMSMRMGEQDDHYEVQAFARHRLAQAAPAPIAITAGDRRDAEDVGLAIADRIRQEMTSGRQWWLDALSPAQREEFEADLASTCVAVCENELPSARPTAVASEGVRERIAGVIVEAALGIGANTPPRADWTAHAMKFVGRILALATLSPAQPEVEPVAPTEEPAIPAGMKRWDGGEEAPKDWDGGPVYVRSGDIIRPGDELNPLTWTHPHMQVAGKSELFGDIIAYTPKATASDAGERETEVDDQGEAMVCTGCGTTRTVAAIRAAFATAFTCCPERKMIPVRQAVNRLPATRDDQVGRLREAMRIARGALQDIAEAEAIPNDAVAFVWCRETARSALDSAGGEVVIREIRAAERRERSTVLTLSCGHPRSIGAHILPDGEIITHVSRMLGRRYDCGECSYLGRPA